jgi:endonuclease-3
MPARFRRSAEGEWTMPDSDNYPIETVLDVLNAEYPYHPMADVTGRDPYKVLICCLLSIRSKDIITMPACTRLFLVADTPEKMLALPVETIAQLIEPVQFFDNKARIIQAVSQELRDRFGGNVPDSINDLDSIKGVGRKTANLVMQLGFNQPAIAVDTHVHRICNRLGYVTTRTPEETELELRRTLPPACWNIINRVMVRHGQEVCIAGRPRCDICPVYDYCQRVGVVPRSMRTPKPKVHEVFIPKQ